MCCDGPSPAAWMSSSKSQLGFSNRLTLNMVLVHALPLKDVPGGEQRCRSAQPQRGATTHVPSNLAPALPTVKHSYFQVFPAFH